MERDGISDKMVILREVCSKLLMLILGITFCITLAIIAYLTYQTIIGSRHFCILWIDILGRLMILLISGYIVSSCGILPLPQRYRINSFIVPLNIWRQRTWRRLFRILGFRVPSHRLLRLLRRLQRRLRRNAASVQENLETPLLQDHDRQYSRSQIRRRTTPIDIVYPDTFHPPVFVSNPEITPNNENTPGISKCSNGSITSIDPSADDTVLPILLEKPSKRDYISEGYVSQESESPDDDGGKVSSKYRKRYSEIKWTDKAAATAVKPLPDYDTATRTRQATLASDAQSAVHTDDGKLAASGKVRRGFEDEMRGDLKPVSDVKTPTINAPVTSGRPLDDKYFEVCDDEKLGIDRELELEKSGNKIPKIHTKNDKVLSKNKLLRKSKSDLPRIHRRNLNSAGETSALLPQECSNNTRENPPERLAIHNRNYESKVTPASKGRETMSELETQLKFPEVSGKNQQSCIETTRKERENATRSRNDETSPNFPRFPWINLRNPKGVSTRANKLHKKNLELEKREIQRYAEIRHRRQEQIDRMIASLLGNVRYQRTVGTSQSNESSNLTARIENLSLGSNKSSDKPIAIKPTRGTDKTNVGQTSRYGATKKQEMVNISSNAENRSNLLLSQKSDRQDYRNISADHATHRRRQLPSQKFQIKIKPRSKIDDKTETKSSSMSEKRTTDNEKYAGSRMTYEASSSNLSKLEDAKRADIKLEETATESFNRLQLDDLREKFVRMEQSRTYLNTSSAAVDSKQILDAKSTELIREPTPSTKPSGEGAAENPDVKISTNSPRSRLENDKDSDLDQSEK